MEDYEIILIIIISILFIILLLSILSRLIYHRSLMASIVELFLRITCKKYDDQVVVDGLKKFEKINDKKYTLPKRLFLKNKVKEIEYKGMQLFIFNECSNTNKAILYIHGGAYVRQPRYEHIKYVKKLAKKTAYKVYLPIYPKAPKHSFEESYDILRSLYNDIRKSHNEVFMMGDSAGGGLALGLCQSFIEDDIKQPDELILLSPWVDISLENERIKDFEKVEPMLSVSNTKIWGRAWANGTRLDDYRLSPIYGNCIGLKSVHIFIGTREILYPDNIILYNVLEESKVKVKLYEGIGMNHVYNVYPIPEARIALNQVLNIIKKRG